MLSARTRHDHADHAEVDEEDIPGSAFDEEGTDDDDDEEDKYDLKARGSLKASSDAFVEVGGWVGG